MVGIKIGEFVKFDPTGMVKVASDDSIEYQNRIYKLSPLWNFPSYDKRTPSNAYQGAKTFPWYEKYLAP